MAASYRCYRVQIFTSLCISIGLIRSPISHSGGNVHAAEITGLFGTEPSYFMTTPVGRIINRFSQVEWFVSEFDQILTILNRISSLWTSASPLHCSMVSRISPHWVCVLPSCLVLDSRHFPWLVYSSLLSFQCVNLTSIDANIVFWLHTTYRALTWFWFSYHSARYITLSSFSTS